MRLSFNEIRARASRFAADYADATYEKGETQTFYNEFFEVFEENKLAFLHQDKTADGSVSRFNKFINREG